RAGPRPRPRDQPLDRDRARRVDPRREQHWRRGDVPLSAAGSLHRVPPTARLMRGSPLVFFLRGVNVGRHRTFLPTVLARELSRFDVVNVGAAGTFVVRQPGSRAQFRAELLRKLPFDAEVVICDARDLIRLETEDPFGAETVRPDIVRFVSILTRAGRFKASVPINLPAHGRWFLRVIASRNRFVLGVYRRHMKTIGYLGQLDRLFGVRVTTRNWNT